MPAAITNHPYFELHFDEHGKPAAGGTDPGAVAAALQQAGVTELFVLSHGWNNDATEARSLYHDLFQQVDAVVGQTPMKGKTLGVVGVIWPSKNFSDEELIPSGGALSVGEATAPLTKKLEGLKGTFSALGADAKLESAKALVPKLEMSPVARQQFAELMLDIMRGAAVEHPRTAQNEDNSIVMMAMHGDELLAAISSPPPKSGLPVGPATGGGALGGMPGGAFGSVAGGAAVAAPTGQATGLADIFHGIVDGARNLLNFTTYYEMKNRAGLVGRGGLYAGLRTIGAAMPALRMHLVGHSFGARVVTAATDGPAQGQPLMPHSLCLLQGAYSHYGMASHWDGTHDGLFRAVLAGKRVQGPIAITHTKNDKAVGIAYAIASRVANQVAAAIGGPDDKYGGIGRNGAQKTPEADNSHPLSPVGHAYGFTRGRAYNLNADKIIMGHSDIRKPEVAYAILMAASPLPA